ncbi:MAG: hypothetical protein U5R06_09955 [candidate division KSB1 bacterium]|nr:hypothetical protein [candidate division KSB1 bacterium]
MKSMTLDCSVIIPNRNRSDTLFRVLHALNIRKQTPIFKSLL